MGALYTGKEIDAYSSTLSSHYCDNTPNSSSSTANYIEHQVSKMDTLSGIAIKYGVEVADIKRMNGLLMDLQMFAHKTLQIPLPGRHSPSPNQAISATYIGEQTPPRRFRTRIESFQSPRLKNEQNQKVSPAMNSLQGYYGLKQPNMLTDEGIEM